MKLVEFDAIVAQDGSRFNFGSHGSFLVSESGGGLPPRQHKFRSGFGQWGQTLVASRYAARRLTYSLQVVGCSRQDWRITVERLLAVIDLQNGNFFTLEKYWNDGTVRCIDVVLEDGGTLEAKDTSSWTHWTELVNLTFVTVDNIFYYDKEESDVYLEAKIDRMVILPHTLPHILGSTSYFEELQIDYLSETARTFPIVELYGPLISPTITLVESGKTISLDYNIADGEVIIVEPELVRLYQDRGSYRYPIRDSNGNDFGGYLKFSSNLVDFYFEPRKYNTVRVDAMGISSNSKVLFRYKKRYLSIVDGVK